MLPSYVPQSISDGFAEDCWEWDINAKSPAAQLSPCRRAVYFHIDPVLKSVGTAGVRGTKGFNHGEHYWEIEFLEPPYGTSVMVGAGTRRALLHTGNYQFINMLGMDSESWGLSYKGTIWHDGQSRQYTEPFYEQATIIGINLNLYTGTMTFYRNGQNLGVAFSGLNKVGASLYPIASSTAAETELQLGVRGCRFHSLQEWCLYTVLQNLRDKNHINALPLPELIKGLLKEF
ncbi:SPRY domain-containing SOCS box protein 3 [Callorhinchus milii]|uniref:SPRY domain-containing SOCS box protein 3 n=1 Tax=Callorhinchus milii TaxID=7868 RepID=A0A4W3JEU6_CALMI|nr:SPRY domain-containing SOCS box protein 3 [Callorhinchus milii]|eukprot:gi/632941365/ref/XP_007885827.1/ PREDICTED: SPRY domain-containing SOCS box protein 3-like [Callorhinchus milii]